MLWGWGAAWYWRSRNGPQLLSNGCYWWAEGGVPILIYLKWEEVNSYSERCFQIDSSLFLEDCMAKAGPGCLGWERSWRGGGGGAVGMAYMGLQCCSGVQGLCLGAAALGVVGSEDQEAGAAAAGGSLGWEGWQVRRVWTWSCWLERALEGIVHSALTGEEEVVEGLESPASAKGNHFYNEWAGTVGSTEGRIILLAWVTSVGRWKRVTCELRLQWRIEVFQEKRGKGRVGGRSLSPKHELECLPSIQRGGKSDKRWAESPGFCWGIQGSAVPRSGFGRLHCRIGVIPGEGVAINLLHYMVIIFEAITEVDSPCVLILFKRKYKNKRAKVRYKRSGSSVILN